MLTSYLSLSLLLVSSVFGRYVERAPKQPCTNTKTNFQESMDNWVLNVPASDGTCQQTSEGLVMKIIPPHHYERLMDPKENLPYNTNAGSGCTVNATTYMQYGKFSATLKSAGEPGAVTAVILMADNGDEIDFELLSGPAKQITSNYFYGPHIVYGVNGDEIDPPQGNVYDQFYTYSIEWSPEKIVWYIDGKPIRTTYKSAEYPTHAARVQIGLWDASEKSGTAGWARGPIDWRSRNNRPVEAIVKQITIECDPEHNDIV